MAPAICSGVTVTHCPIEKLETPSSKVGFVPTASSLFLPLNPNTF